MNYPGHILGVDSNRKGAAVLMDTSGAFLDAITWKPQSKRPPWEAAALAASYMERRCNTTDTVAIVEKPWGGKNIKTAIVMGQYSGIWFRPGAWQVVQAEAVQWRAVVGISTRLVREKAKAEALAMVRHLWPGLAAIGQTKLTEDLAEAVLIAETGRQMIRFSQTIQDPAWWRNASNWKDRR